MECAEPQTSPSVALHELGEAAGCNSLAPRGRGLEDVLVRMSIFVKSRGLEVAGVFDDFARSRWSSPGHVTTSQYSRAMDSLGFRLTQQELLSVFHAFADTVCGNEFNYVKFSDSIDPSRGTSAPATGSRSTRPHTPSRNGSQYYDRNGRILPLTSRPSSAPSTRCPVRRSIYTVGQANRPVEVK